MANEVLQIEEIYVGEEGRIKGEKELVWLSIKQD